MSCVRPVGLCLLMVAIASRAGEGPQQTVVTIAYSEAGSAHRKHARKQTPWHGGLECKGK